MIVSIISSVRVVGGFLTVVSKDAESIACIKVPQRAQTSRGCWSSVMTGGNRLTKRAYLVDGCGGVNTSTSATWPCSWAGSDAVDTAEVLASVIWRFLAVWPSITRSRRIISKPMRTKAIAKTVGYQSVNNYIILGFITVVPE
jgi:hypothetical protein